MEYKNITHKIYTVQTVLRNKPFYRGGVEPPNKFAKRGGLNRISIFRRGDFFQGEGVEVIT